MPKRPPLLLFMLSLVYWRDDIGNAFRDEWTPDDPPRKDFKEKNMLTTKTRVIERYGSTLQ